MIELPEELPEKPEGWTQIMKFHMRIQGGGAATYSVHDPSGQEMPFWFAYNTAEKVRGFGLPGKEGLMTWAQLRACWPAWRAEVKS